MIAIPRTKCGIRFHDVFFAEDPQAVTEYCRLAHISQCAAPFDGCSPCVTKIIDLTRDEEALFNTLSSNTRYKIRRADREGMIPFFNTAPGTEDITAFCSHFDPFARSKKLPLSNRNKLLGLQHIAALIIAGVSDSTHTLVVTHAYIADRTIERLRLLYSASHFRSVVDSEERNRIGRANRFLHWHVMRAARTAGYRHYDLGGIPRTDSDPEKNAIARFKSEFGGDTATEYVGFISRHRLVQRSIPVIQRVFA